MSDYEARQRYRNISVGVFVILAIGAFGWLIYQFGDLPLIVSELKSYQVRVQFPVIQGVQLNTPVRFCGYQVGRVTKVTPPKLLKEVSGNRFFYQTIVIISIDKAYSNIPDNVDVRIMTRGLGSSYIELKQTDFDLAKSRVSYLDSNSVLVGASSTVSEFFPEESQRKFNETLDGIKALMGNVNDILGNESNKTNIEKVLANLKEATAQLTETLKEMRNLSSAGVHVSEDLAKVLTDLNVLINNLQNGQGTVGRLMNDPKLYEELLEDTAQLRLLLQDMRTFINKATESGIPIKLK